jgi:hypothetical protein
MIIYDGTEREVVQLHCWHFAYVHNLRRGQGYCHVCRSWERLV